MSPEQATAQLNELTGRVNAAVERYRAARDAAREPWAPAREVTAKLAAYHAAVMHRQRDRDPEEPRRLTLDLLQRIEDQGYVLEPLDPIRPAAGLRVVDPRLSLQVEAAEAAARRAAAQRNEFATEHAALLREHREREQMTRIKDALSGNDPAAFRDALAALDPAPASPTALRTDDLAVTR